MEGAGEVQPPGMKRRTAWFVIVTAVTLVLQVGAHQLQEALVLDYRLPPRVAQEVAAVAFDRYVRTESWEQARYFYYVQSSDRRVDVGRLVQDSPFLPHVTVKPYARGIALATGEDYLAGRLKRFVKISGVVGTWKRVRVRIGTYVSPVGAWSVVFTLERRWWGWAIVKEEPDSLMS